MVAVYSQPIFHSYPAALWVSLAGPFEALPNFQNWLRVSIVETTWTLPFLQVCPVHEPYIIEDSVYAVSNLLF